MGEVRAGFRKTLDLGTGPYPSSADWSLDIKFLEEHQL